MSYTNPTGTLRGKAVAEKPQKESKPAKAERIRTKKNPAFVAAKLLRIVTLAPVVCLIMLTVLFFRRPDVFPLLRDYILAVVFLTAFPLLAYPVHAVIPPLRKTGRKGQRIFAILTAVAGYVTGIVVALCMRQPKELLLIYTTYLFSGILIALCSFVFKFKASAHFCGVTGPIAMLVYMTRPFALLGLAVLPALVWGTLRLKRHTVPQMLVGSLVPLAAMGIAWLCLFL